MLIIINIEGIFIKRNVYLILIVLLLSIAFSGCTGSHDKSQASSPQSAQTTPANTDNGDDAWLGYVKNNTVDLGNTMDGISKSIKSGEFGSLQGYSEVLTMSADQLIKEDDYYKISPKYQEANKEWLAGLKDYSACGKHLHAASIDAQNGRVNEDDMKWATELRDSGTGHMKKTADLIKTTS
jgi:hypothetical protein